MDSFFGAWSIKIPWFSFLHCHRTIQLHAREGRTYFVIVFLPSFLSVKTCILCVAFLVACSCQYSIQTWVNTLFPCTHPSICYQQKLYQAPYFMAVSCQFSSNKNLIKNSTWWHVLLSVLSTKTWYEALCLVTPPCPFSVNKTFVGNTASCKIPSNVVSTNAHFKHTASWRVLVNITTKLVSRAPVTGSCQCFKHTIHDTFKSALYHSLCQTYNRRIMQRSCVGIPSKAASTTSLPDTALSLMNSEVATSQPSGSP